MGFPAGAETIELEVSLKLPDYIVHGRTREEQEKDLFQSAVIQAYLRNEITLMKAGTLLGFKDHEEVCRFFISMNVPTMKNLPEDLKRTQDENRALFEEQLGVK